MGKMRTNAAFILLTLVTLVAWSAAAQVGEDRGRRLVKALAAAEAAQLAVEEAATAESSEADASEDGGGEVAAALIQTCEEPGEWVTTSVGVNRFRGNVFRIDDHAANEAAKLTEIGMELRFTGTVDLYFSVHSAPSTAPDQVFTEVRSLTKVTATNTGAQLFFTRSVSPPINLLPGNDYLIGVSWTQTNNPIATNRGVTVGNDGSGVAPPPFLHGETLGVVAFNSVTPPLAESVPDAFVFDTFGAYSMRLCFDPVPGACCAPTASCSTAVEAACTGPGAFFYGERTSCDDVFCDYGACCGPCGGGDCEVHYSPDACVAEGGEWAGSGVTCEHPELCEPILGACCDGAACSEVCVDDCLATGGTYQGDFTTCEPNFCAGACCAASVGCADVTSAICGFLSGTFRGNGTTCAGLTSQQECGGACCATVQGQRVCLQVNNRGECSASQGLVNPVYLGDRITCSPGICTGVESGACCLPNGSCSVTTELYCIGDPADPDFNGAGGAWAAGLTCGGVTCRGCCAGGGCTMTTDGTCDIGSPIPDCVPNSCDDVIGACCVIDDLFGIQSCEAAHTASSCRNLGGRFEEGSDCTGCPAGLGACCRPSAACKDLVTEDECNVVFGGEFKGELSLCDDVILECENRGACCTDTGSCVFVTRTGCQSLTGNAELYFEEEGVECVPGACPSGACCDLTTETCSLRRNDACVGIDKVYQGDGTTCEPGLCTVGACCVAGECLNILETQCIDGVFSPGADCSSADACVEGACCLNNECSTETQSACVSAGGVYQGAGMPCNAELCTLGSCCLRTNTCASNFVRSQCQALDGLAFRPGISCQAPIACPLFGTCCLPDGSCQDIVNTECAELHGAFLAGGECAATTCVPFGACCQGGSCSEVEEAECTGVYVGDGTICDGAVCALGSCCTNADPPACQDDLIEFECDGIGGLHRSGVTCVSGPSCDVRGACCFEESGTCADDVRPGTCGAGGGVFTSQALCSEVPCELKGACCADGLCSVTTRADCEAGVGDYNGDNTACAVGLCRLGACCHLDGTCDDDAVRGQCTGTFDRFDESLTCAATCIGRGACCLPDRECLEAVTELQCIQNGGVFDGFGSECSPDLCVIGACCFVGVPPVCDDTTFTRLACDLNDGVYQSAGQMCTEELCVTGSCCRVDGSCGDVVFASECLAPDIFREAMACDDVENPCVARGACCLGESCQLLTQADCLGQAGVYGGNGTLCDPSDQCVTGACCLTDSGCAPRIKRVCDADGGFFQGQGSTCQDAGLDCTRGACCALNGACTDATIASRCTTIESAFTPGVVCDAVPCDPRGACCTGSVCTLDTQANCVTGGGMFNGVESLCEPNPCQSQLISIISSDPPNCAIDARQPSEPNGSNPAGWSGIVLTFDGDATGTTANDFIVTGVGVGTPPGIASATPAGNIVTIVFDTLIPLRTWICVEHVDSGSQVCVVHLPADVSNDRTSSAPDILFLIDCLNGVRTCQVQQCDADRSNVCGPPDILRVIDLLNGAGAFDPWLNVSVPVCPSAP